jgi:hypothetical protein
MPWLSRAQPRTMSPSLLERAPWILTISVRPFWMKRQTP